MNYTTQSANYDVNPTYIKLDGIKTRFAYTPRIGSSTPRMLPFLPNLAWYID